jgi:mannitol/fructose-specific phosphotransferase system IIA component
MLSLKKAVRATGAGFDIVGVAGEHNRHIQALQKTSCTLSSESTWQPTLAAVSFDVFADGFRKSRHAPQLIQ